MNKTVASIYPSPFDNQIRHELNASIFSNGKIFSYEEAKITSVKNDGTPLFPERTLFLGFKQLNISPKDVDIWVIPKPKKKDINQLKIFFTFIKAYNDNKIEFNHWFKKKVRFIRHHDLHAYLAIGSSNFNNGVYFNIDGGGDFGDRRHTSWGKFYNGKLIEYKNLQGLNSLANFHSFITEFCGFNSENGKVSGLASYGKLIPELKKKLEKVIKVNNSGIFFERKRFEVTDPIIKNMKCDSYDRNKILRGEISKTNIFKICEGYLPQDVARTAEDLISEKIIFFLKSIKKKYFKKTDNIVFSGGLFLNVKINADIEKEGIFKNCFFPMSPSDSGLSLGGIFSQRIKLNKKFFSKYGLSPLLGPSFTESEITSIIKKFKMRFSIPSKLEKDIASEIEKKKIVGVFNGRAEFGQRSLGSRSILADPRNKMSKNILNQKIKRRDWFMPFAPAVIDNKFKKYFKTKIPSMYMQKAEDLNKKFRKLIPSAVHVNNTCRAQFVDRKVFPFFWRILKEFYKKTSIPIVLNTSFNRHGISTICTPRQAVEHLLEGNIDILYLHRYKIEFQKNRRYKAEKNKFLSDQDELFIECKKWLKINKFKMSSKSIKKFNNYLKKL